MKLTGAKAIVEALKREGVEIAFGYPGGAIMPLYDELYLQSEELRHILVRHEQGAAHAAEGYAKASGKTGVCISTSGPGGTNLATGIADANLDSVPMVALSAQVATKAMGSDAFQEADMFGMMMPITKHNYKLMRAQDIPITFKNAFHIASTGRPGPVHIDIPKDVQVGEFDFEYPAKPDLRGYNPNYDGHPLQMKEAAALIANAERPVIMVGGGVITSGAMQEVARLSETLMAPIVTTLMGKGAIDERHPLCLGMIGMHGRKVANYAIESCDVLIAVGTRMSDRSCGDFASFAEDAKIIHIDLDSSEIGKNVRCDLPIQGDAKRVLSHVLMHLEKIRQKEKAFGRQSAWGARIKDVRDACVCDYDSYDETPMAHRRVVGELQKFIDANTVIVADVGQHQMWAAHHLKVAGPRKFLTSGGLGTMGFSLPASLGAKAALPDAKVVSFVGDGGMLMTNQELVTSVADNFPIFVMVMNNGWLGMVKQWQKIFCENRFSATELRGKVDFVKLAESMGCDSMRASSPSELVEGLKAGFAKGSQNTFLLDVMVHPEEEAYPMFLPGNKLSVCSMFGKCPFKSAVLDRHPPGKGKMIAKAEAKAKDGKPDITNAG